MTAKEVKKELHTEGFVLKFAEKNAIIFPSVSENGNKDYSSYDVKKLKELLIYMAADIDFDYIKKIFSGDITPKDAVSAIADKQELSENDSGVACIMRQLILNDENPHIDIDYCWNVFNENSSKMYTDPRAVFDFYLNYFFMIKTNKNKKSAILKSILAVLVICTVSGLSKHFIWHENFAEGFFYPLILFAIVLAIVIPLAFIGKKRPNVSLVLAKILTIICITFLGAILLLLVVLLLNSVFHFWF